MGKRVPCGERYNARGERFCATCERHLPVDHFGKRSANRDGLAGSCRACLNATHRRQCGRLFQDEAHWRGVLERNRRNFRKRIERRADEQRRFGMDAMRLVQARGFSRREVTALTGLTSHSLIRLASGDARYFQRQTIDALTRLMLVTGDLPIVGPPARGGRRNPHPALDLVRARLTRMAELEELEAA